MGYKVLLSQHLFHPLYFKTIKYHIFTMSNQNCPHMQKDTWYTDAVGYWEKINPTISGMLGGLDQVQTPDVRDSKKFLAQTLSKINPNATEKTAKNETYACDCGAGIGRVSKHFLLDKFNQVDLVEQNPQFLETARTDYLKTEYESGRIGEFFAKGLQEFTPEEGKYDVIWCQWVLGHLTDTDLVQFLKRCKNGLKNSTCYGGFIGIKENVASRENYVFDSDDSSVTRDIKSFELIFKTAGYKIVHTQTQQNMPRGLFRVQMWALQPE